MIFYLILNILFNSLELHKTSFKGLFLYTWNGETISQVQIGVPLGWNILVYLLLWYFACQAVLRSELLIIGISPRKAPFYHCIDNSVIYILIYIPHIGIVKNRFKWLWNSIPSKCNWNEILISGSASSKNSNVKE